MSQRTNHAIIEIRRSFVAIVRLPEQIVLVRRQDGLGLPNPADVRSACEDAGMRIDSCTLILPRNEWLLHLGIEQKAQRAEALAAARLDAEVAASTADVDVITGVSALRVRRGYVRPFWASIPRYRAEQVIEWATACGWDVEDLRCATFEVARGVRGKERCDLQILIVFYPGGEWELHGFRESTLTSTYAGVQPWDKSATDEDSRNDFDQELFRALVIVCLQDLSGEAFHLELGISGQAPGGLNKVLERMRQTFDEKGVAMTWRSEHAEPLMAQTAPWPGAAVIGANQVRSRIGESGYPVILRRGREEQASSIWQRTVFRGVAAVILLMVITFSLGMVRQQVMDQLIDVQAITADAKAEGGRVVSARQANEDFQTRIKEVRGFFDRRDQILATFFALNDVLMPGAHVETLVIEGDTVRFGVVAPSAVAVVERMQANPDFRNISMDSAVTVDRRNGNRQERVTISAFLDRGRGL